MDWLFSLDQSIKESAATRLSEFLLFVISIKNIPTHQYKILMFLGNKAKIFLGCSQKYQ